MSTFQQMPLPTPLKQAFKDLNFSRPTEVQAATIPLSLKGKDLMVCAETGSGKTAAYSIPMIASLLEDPKKHALILAPTRELAQQIADVVRSLVAHAKDLKTSTLVGGADIRKQLKSLKRRPQIVIATPGRLMDHLKRKSLTLNSTALLVLDEGDRMLDMGFAPQLDAILNYLPKKRQTMLFTATLPPKVKKLAEKYLYQPESISVGQVSKPVRSIKQAVIQTTVDRKDEQLVDELNRRQGSIIIFAKTQIRTDKLSKFLGQYGFAVSRIHGGRTQGQRNQAIKGFREGQFRILCATDVAARGIDVPHVEHVINYDLPMMLEDYVHRIGRTGRNGAEGEALSFVLPHDHKTWNTLIRKYDIPGVELQGGSQKRDFRGGNSSGGRPQSKKAGFRKRSSFAGRRSRPKNQRANS